VSVWLTIPSKRPPEEAEKVLRLWRERGYKIALWGDGPGPYFEWGSSALTVQHPVYPGYAQAVNRLIAIICEHRPTAEWFVAAGDDVQPDLNHTAEEVAEQCTEHFGGAIPLPGVDRNPKWRTFGVMQPTGDRWGDRQGAYIDRVCGSAWIGREFATCMYQGDGPLWPEYFHMFVDEELQTVAEKMGVFWQRPDLIQRHNHWGRTEPGKPLPNRDRMPEFLKEANSAEQWDKAQKLFRARKAAGFPGHEPL
jgi:hypothetical protein